MRKRIVITGMGAVTPVGNDVATFWQALVAGRTVELPAGKLRLALNVLAAVNTGELNVVSHDWCSPFQLTSRNPDRQAIVLSFGSESH